MPLHDKLMPPTPGTIYGPNGAPVSGPGLARIVVTDEGITYASPGQQMTVNPRQMLMAMARRKRDGASDAQVFDEFGIKPGTLGVTWDSYNAAIKAGEQLLKEAIARGEAPAETMGTTVEFLDDEEDE